MSERTTENNILDFELRLDSDWIAVSKSAEAVVDAAILCHFARTGEDVRTEVRAMLVEAVLRDPRITKELFTVGIPRIQ